MVRQANPAPGGGRATAGVVAGIMGGIAGAAGPVSTQANTPNAAMRRETSTEDLGTKLIDGVLCYGTRRTTVIPEGAQGNDRPMTTTNETWMSRDLQLIVLSTNYSPASGTLTTKIANLSTAEPNPGLVYGAHGLHDCG